MEVLRRCPLAMAQRLVHCAAAVSTAVLGQSHKDNVRCTAVEEQPEAKEVQLSQPSSTSLLKISSGLTWGSNFTSLLLIDWLIDDHLYSAILRSLEQTHCARLWFYMSDKLFIARFLNIHRSGVLTALAWLVPHETAAISAQVLCTPYNHALCHLMQSHIRKVYASLAVTCHLHFWQNDRDLLRATAVTRGWNGYRN